MCIRDSHEACRAQTAFGVVGAAAALVGDLDAFAGAGEQHGVLAHDVTATHGGKADAAARTLAGVAVPAVLAYNVFGKRVAACEAELEGFALDLRELQLDREGRA